MIAITYDMLDEVPTFERNYADVCLQSQSVRPLDQMYIDTINHFRNTLTTSKKGCLYEEVKKVFQRSRHNNWDNEGSCAVSESTFDNAVKLILAIPSYVPSPEIEVDPDGEISFEWYIDKSKLLFISVSADGRLSYAGRFTNNSKANGEEWVNNDEIPDEIIHYITKLKK